MIITTEKATLSGTTADSWRRLGQAVDFYNSCGFEYIDVPWEAQDLFVDATKPEGGHQVRVYSTLSTYNMEGRQLVASAEQSLLQYLYTRKLHGAVMAVTPCFRSESALDELRRRYFMKLELCISAEGNQWVDKEEEQVDHVTQCALQFFHSQFATAALVVATPEADGETAQGLITRYSRDIVVPVENAEPIEIGSYGFRSWTHPDGTSLQWVYGTGLAEPRFSVAVGRTHSWKRERTRHPQVLMGKTAQRLLDILQAPAQEPKPRMRQALENYERLMGGPGGPARALAYREDRENQEGVADS